VKVVGDMLAWGAGRSGLAARRRQGKDAAPERGDAEGSKELLDPWHLKGARTIGPLRPLSKTPPTSEPAPTGM